jgi:hypothetical protein
MQLKRTTLTALLIVLATLSFATAAITLTNITEWHVQSAGTPPIVKVVGTDVNGTINSNDLVSIYRYIAADGTNRTKIIIKGYTGDWTNYTSVLQICNKGTDGHKYTVQLQFGGFDTSVTTSSYFKYLVLHFNGETMTITSSGATPTTIGSATLTPNQCVDVGADVLVAPEAPSGSDLVSVYIDVVSTRQ